MDKKERKGKLKKSAVRNKYSFHVNESEVIDCTNFGSFEIVRTKKEIIFRTYTGYHVCTSPYTMDISGSAVPTSLYRWLNDLVEMKIEFSGHEHELYDENVPGVTKGDMLESLKMVTVSNLVMPMAVFVDANKAAEAADIYMNWLNKMGQELLSNMEGDVPEDIDEREYAIERAKADVIDTMQVISSESGEIGI